MEPHPGRPAGNDFEPEDDEGHEAEDRRQNADCNHGAELEIGAARIHAGDVPERLDDLTLEHRDRKDAPGRAENDADHQRDDDQPIEYVQTASPISRASANPDLTRSTTTGW